MTTQTLIRFVLLVDDDPNIRDLAQMALEGMTDWKIETACSGVQALEQAKACRPDVILLDQKMPEMDGIHTVMLLKESAELGSVPVIMMTGQVLPEELEQFQNLGLAGIIAKPFDPISLSSEIEKIVNAVSPG